MWVRWQVNRNRVITRNTSGTIGDWVQIFLQCFRGGSYVWSYISDWKRFNFRSFDGCWLFFWMTSYLLLITLHFFTLFFLQPLAHFAKYFRHTYFANFLHANCCCRRHNNLRNVEQWAVILAYLLNRVLIFFYWKLSEYFCLRRIRTELFCVFKNYFSSLQVFSAAHRVNFYTSGLKTNIF